MTQDNTTGNLDATQGHVVLGSNRGKIGYGAVFSCRHAANEHRSALVMHHARRPLNAPASQATHEQDLERWAAAHPGGERGTRCTRFQVMTVPWIDPAAPSTPA